MSDLKRPTKTRVPSQRTGLKPQWQIRGTRLELLRKIHRIGRILQKQAGGNFPAFVRYKSYQLEALISSLFQLHYHLFFEIFLLGDALWHL